MNRVQPLDFKLVTMNQLNLFFRRGYLLLLWLFICSESIAQLSEPLPFLTKSPPVSARIIEYNDRNQSSAPAALVRLPNQKVILMTRHEGQLEPFFIKAIETGYWDTRYEKDTNYDSVFSDMKEIGANTVYVMIHWEDIEPQDNQFDFSFTDSLVNAAYRQGLKIKWVLFLHAQGRVPSLKPETAWTFHLDDRDSSNYTMQWVKKKETVYTCIKDVLKYAVRPLHVYGHPEIFYRIRRMLYQLAVHYRDSETVIGVQVGNEEGYSFLDDSDYNPVTAELFRQWKLKTNKTAYAQFKRESMNWWWMQFTSAFHEGDPYKILSFNLDAGQAEGGDLQRMLVTGTDAGTYADGNLDAIGTMLYKDWGYKAILGIDRRYGNSYQYALPLFVPSEIGIGVFNHPIHFRHFVMHSLERAAQGFGVYCYGEVRKELPTKKLERLYLTQLLEMIRLNEDIIATGLPGTGDVRLTSYNISLQISHLHTEQGETLAMIYFPEAALNPDSCINLQPFLLDVKAIAAKSRKYKFTIYRDGVEVAKKTLSCSASTEADVLSIEKVKREDILFVRIE